MLTLFMIVKDENTLSLSLGEHSGWEALALEEKREEQGDTSFYVTKDQAERTLKQYRENPRAKDYWMDAKVVEVEVALKIKVLS